MCVCVCERERERGGERESTKIKGPSKLGDNDSIRTTVERGGRLGINDKQR